MKEIVTYKRLSTTTSMGEGITLTHSFFSFNAEDIDRLERLFREKIKTALIVDTVMTDSGEQNERKNNRRTSL